MTVAIRPSKVCPSWPITVMSSFVPGGTKARASGIHLIIATQKPSADVIITNLRSNLPAQLSLRVKSGTESRVIMDQGGAETLNGNGDAYFKLGGSVIRVQCGLVSEADSNEVLEKFSSS